MRLGCAVQTSRTSIARESAEASTLATAARFRRALRAPRHVGSGSGRGRGGGPKGRPGEIAGCCAHRRATPHTWQPARWRFAAPPASPPGPGPSSPCAGRRGGSAPGAPGAPPARSAARRRGGWCCARGTTSQTTASTRGQRLGWRRSAARWRTGRRRPFRGALPARCGDFRQIGGRCGGSGAGKARRETCSHRRTKGCMPPHPHHGGACTAFARMPHAALAAESTERAEQDEGGEGFRADLVW